MKRFFALAPAAISVVLSLGLASCAGNPNQAEADKITRAVVNNDMSPVSGDLAPSVKGEITRVRIAELSDQLNADGPYQGLKEDTTWCKAGFHCFDVQFAKRPYYEVMRIDSGGKVDYWWIRDTKSE